MYTYAGPTEWKKDNGKLYGPTDDYIANQYREKLIQIVDDISYCKIWKLQ